MPWEVAPAAPCCPDPRRVAPRATARARGGGGGGGGRGGRGGGGGGDKLSRFALRPGAPAPGMQARRLAKRSSLGSRRGGAALQPPPGPAQAREGALPGLPPLAPARESWRPPPPPRRAAAGAGAGSGAAPPPAAGAATVPAPVLLLLEEEEEDGEEEGGRRRRGRGRLEGKPRGGAEEEDDDEEDDEDEEVVVEVVEEDEEEYVEERFVPPAAPKGQTRGSLKAGSIKREMTFTFQQEDLKRDFSKKISYQQLFPLAMAEDVRTADTKKAHRVPEHEKENTRSICLLEQKRKVVSSNIDVPPARKSSEELDMDKVTAAMVLTSLSTSPLVRSPPVRPNEGLSGSWKEGGFVPSSTSSSGYWSWSAPSDQSNPSTPSPPLSADSFKPFRTPAQPDDGIDETEASNLLFDEPIPRKRKNSMKVMFKCLWKNCGKVLSTAAGIQKHIRTIHLGRIGDSDYSDGEEDFYYTEIKLNTDSVADGLSNLSPVSPSQSLVSPPTFSTLDSSRTETPCAKTEPKLMTPLSQSAPTTLYLVHTDHAYQATPPVNIPGSTKFSPNGSSFSISWQSPPVTFTGIPSTAEEKGFPSLLPLHMDRIAGSQMEEDRALHSRDSYTSSPKDLFVDSSSSEKEIENEKKEQNHGNLWGISLKDTSLPTVTDLWPQFRHGKTLRFFQLFETQKTPSMWQEVRGRLRKRKKKKAQCPLEPTLGDPQIVRSPDPEECLTDDEIKMMAPVAPQPGSRLADCSQAPPSEEVAPWRYGPAKLWYDMLGVPPHGRGFDYGFRLREKPLEEEETTQTDHSLLKDENFLMVTQKSWEDDIIWDNQDIQRILPDAQKVSQAGWIPSEKTKLLKTGNRDPSQPGGSIFIPESEDLIYSQWEDNIIWDAQAMHKPLYPTVLTIDPDDENLLLFDIKEPEEVESSAQKQLSEKGQTMLRCGITGEEETEQTPAQLKAKDPWNLSNDEFYFPQEHGLRVPFRDPIIQHSVPALKLHSSLFPTHMVAEQLSLFHRPPVRWLGKGPHPVHNLASHILKKAQEREQELQASGGGHMFFMKTLQDLSGQDGDLILVEWSEENPPFLNQVGMASQIQNYYKRKNGKDTEPPACKYGNPVFCSSSPFLGQLHSGQFLQALENKLFRAPIYPHQMADTDFLVVVTKAGYFLREVKDIFTVGQQCPLDEVPAPNSKMAKNYIHEFLQVFIYRQFWKSPHRPRRIRMEDIHRAFPRLSESSVRRRLTKCSDFHRTGIYFNWWVLKTGFRLPSEEELRVMVTPEKCCALYSMQAAQQRLKDAGYGEISLLNTEETSDESVCFNDEVQAAPWNTTRAFLAATKGQCLLEVTGAADPTGCGEGISYVKVACKPKQEKEAGKVMGTDADLRRLTLKEAKKLLRVSGMSEEEIQKLSRWEVVTAIRALSTKELYSGTKTRTLTRFARVPHSFRAEQQRHYQQQVQRVFDLQNKLLASTEVLSTDTDSSSSDEENGHVVERMSCEIEDLLEGETSPQRLQREKEKQELQELRQLMLRDGATRLQDKGKKEKRGRGSTTSTPMSLVIHRTYIDESGKEYVRSEIVRDPAVVRAYVLVRSTKDEDSVRKILLAEEQKQQELRKEKKRLQDKLRRICKAEKRKEQKERLPLEHLPKPEAPKLGLICGNCGSHGHIKTNKMCPKYCPPKDLGFRLKVMTREQEEKELAKQLPQESLIKLQGTKIFMKGKLFETMNEVQRQTLKVKVEKQPLPQKSQSGPPQQRQSVCLPEKSQSGPPQKKQCVHLPQESQSGPPQKRQCVTLPQNSQSDPPQKRQFVHMDPSESLSCIRHPCQPAPPCPPSSRRAKSPHLVPSPQKRRCVPLPQKSQSGPPQERQSARLPRKSQSGPPQKRQCVSLLQESQSGSPQKRQFVHMDPSESLSCIQHLCQPAPPCPPSSRHAKSPHPVPSPQKRRCGPLAQESQSGPPQKRRPVPLTQESQSGSPQKRQPVPLPQESQSGSPQKKQFVPLDPSESLSCIQHPCQPVPPCPSSNRYAKSPHPVPSPQVPLERPGRTPSVELMAKPLQKTLPPPVQLVQSEPEPPSEPLRKDWSLQNWLQQKYRSLTGPSQKGLDFMAQPQKPVIPLPKAGPIPPCLRSHSARKSQNPLTCSKPWLCDSSDQQCKRPRNSLCQLGQELTQEPTIASRQVPRDKLGRSLQRPPLDKDTEPVPLQKSGAGVPQVPSLDRITNGPAPKHQRSILYEDLQVSDTDEEENNEEKEKVSPTHNRPVGIGEQRQQQNHSVLSSPPRGAVTLRKPRGEGKKCRKVYGMENRDMWCTACRWKKACQRFID